MIFQETALKGAYIISPEKMEDERGFFMRTFCKKEFAQHGLSKDFVQTNISYNKKKGTFRGMHYQIPPHEEEKLVSCRHGAIMDYIIDLRADSSTYKKWIAVELSHANGLMLYIPKSFAHGFLSLVDDTEICYYISEFHQPDFARGFRWNDPAFSIELPGPVQVILKRDANYPFFDQPEVTKIN